MNKWLLTVLFLIGSAFLTHLIPFSSFFRYLDTTIHEFGHAAVTLALSGKVMYIELYADHSGVTRSMMTRSWAILPVSLAGYMTASLFAWLLFALHARELHRRGLFLITLLAALSLALFVRNGYGMVWLAGFIALNAVVMLWGGQTVTRWYYLLVAFLTLEESVFGPFSLFLMAMQRPGQAGDASLLASVTAFPAVFWASWFTLFGLWCAKRALQSFFGGKRKQKRAWGTVTPEVR
ncbi:M50 family metallopeptidase [Gorillibacterium sp. sgz5001074]|uniref:M50 family metallopeptidase n=1 Tax=Gorillibacterium sp. sgz5001074 TaxID=3446695 RepID=UPI003F66B458